MKASGGNGVIDLFWSNPANASITGYQYQTKTYHFRGTTDPYTQWQSISGAGASTVSFTIPSLVTNKTYSIRFRAGNAAGWSGYQTIRAHTWPTYSPTGLAATPGDGSFTLTWDAPLARYGITGYQFRHVRPGVPHSWSSWMSLPGSARSHTVTGLVNGAQYHIWLKAVSAAGESHPVGTHVTPTAATPSG